MNVGFAGTPAFAATVLTALFDAGYPVTLVLTQPDRPHGRGLQRDPSPVKRLAQERGVPLHQPEKLAGEAARQLLVDARIDVLAVAAYGLLLPPAFLATPRHGCINVHASLLPRWRGAAPIQRALLAGDAETGATLMQMDAGLDTGPMLDVVRVPIGPRDTAGTLESALATAGARALVAALQRLAAGDALARTPQPATGVTYAAKIAKSEAAIDWSAAAVAIDRQVRAFDPAPGAFAEIDGLAVKVWRAQPDATPSDAPAGTVLDTRGECLRVACGEGTLGIDEVQPAGGRRMSAAAFVAGRRIVAGARFGVRG